MSATPISSWPGSLRAPPRHTLRQLRFPGGLFGDEPSSFLPTDTLMPTRSAMCSNFIFAGEKPFAGLAFLEDLPGLLFWVRAGDIGGEIGCGELGGFVMPSSEPSLKRLWWPAVWLLVMETMRRCFSTSSEST